MERRSKDLKFYRVAAPPPNMLPFSVLSSQSEFLGSYDAHSAAADCADGELSVGTRVEARYGGQDEWFPGQIMSVDRRGPTFRGRLHASYDILYEDGDTEEGVSEDFVRPLHSARDPSAAFMHPITVAAARELGRRAVADVLGPAFALAVVPDRMSRGTVD